MKIYNFESYKKAIDKLDNMTSPTDKPATIFSGDTSLSKKMEKFFQLADGENQGWNI